MTIWPGLRDLIVASEEDINEAMINGKKIVVSNPGGTLTSYFYKDEIYVVDYKEVQP
jgi:hypothetical protein